MSLFSNTNPELKALKEKIEKVNAEVAAQFENAEFRRELSQEITQTVYEGFLHENLVELFTNVERLPRNGRSTIKEVRGLKAFHIARGGYIEESDMHAEVMEIEKDQIGFHVRENTDRLEENFAETADTLVTLGKVRIDAEINRRVLAAYQAAVSPSSPYYIATSGVTLTQINAAIAAVQDSTVSGELPTIVGRAPIVRKIEDALTANNTYSLFLPETNEQLKSRGVLGSYRGVNIITLKNHLDEEGQSYFPANELWFIGRDAGKTAFFGEPKFKNFIEDDNWYWHYLYRMEYGVAVTRPDRTRRLVDSTITP